MLRSLLLLLGFLAPFCLKAQKNKKSVFKHPYINPPNQLDVSEYRPNNDTTVYYAIHTMFRAMEPFSYFSVIPIQRQLLDDLQPKRPDEADRADIETNMYMSLTILRGRGNHKDWQQASKLSFVYWSQIRIARQTSGPILPPTNSFGLKFNYAPWDNFRKWCLKGLGEEEKNKLQKDLESGFMSRNGKFDYRNFWKEQDSTTFQLLTLQTSLMHYSNGQGSGFFVDSLRLRHDYLNGDFSTNFVQFMASHHWAWPGGQIYSMSGGWRGDFQIAKKLFQFTDEQKLSYGRSRFLLNLQYVTRPLKAWNLKNRVSVEFPERKKYHLKELINLQLRTEMVFITDDLSDWRRVGMVESDNKYRFSIRTSLKVNILRNRNFGLLFQHYYGRDYHNIRFDNVIHIFHAGLNFKFNNNPVISQPKQNYIEREGK